MPAVSTATLNDSSNNNLPREEKYMAIHYGAVDGTFYPVEETYIQTESKIVKVKNGPKYGETITFVPAKKIYIQKGVDVGPEKGVFRDKSNVYISSEITQSKDSRNAMDIHKHVMAVKINDGIKFNTKTKR